MGVSVQEVSKEQGQDEDERLPAMCLDKHKAMTAVRANAYGEQFAGTFPGPPARAEREPQVWLS